MLAFAVGCATDEAPKASHFEHDHEVAAHWPNDLVDAAEKIRERIARFNGEPVELHHSDAHDDHHDHDHAESRDASDPERLLDEITELVSWVPEIAADTNLSEQDWIPLDDAARAMTANLRSTSDELTAGHQEKLIALCELIEQSAEKVPDQLPPLKRTSS